jgi:hypothetical protein
VLDWSGWNPLDGDWGWWRAREEMRIETWLPSWRVGEWANGRVGELTASSLVPVRPAVPGPSKSPTLLPDLNAMTTAIAAGLGGRTQIARGTVCPRRQGLSRSYVPPPDAPFNLQELPTACGCEFRKLCLMGRGPSGTVPSRLCRSAGGQESRTPLLNGTSQPQICYRVCLRFRYCGTRWHRPRV